MEKKLKKINTEIGYIAAKRNAIYLDYFKQQDNTMSLVGEISANWCEKKSKNCKWYSII